MNTNENIKQPQVGVSKLNDGLDDFGRGVRAMFDYLLYRAANNYHGNPEIQKQCNNDNTLIEEWAIDALEEISPNDYSEWKSICNAYDDGFKTGNTCERKRCIKLLEDAINSSIEINTPIARAIRDMLKNEINNDST
jgi:hypothetical protein